MRRRATNGTTWWKVSVDDRKGDRVYEGELKWWRKKLERSFIEKNSWFWKYGFFKGRLPSVLSSAARENRQVETQGS